MPCVISHDAADSMPKFSQFPFFDRLALEGALCPAPPDILTLIDETHKEINRTNQIYLAQEPANYYFIESGRDPQTDWSIGADFTNLTPPAEACFIEFSPARRAEFPLTAGVMFIFYDLWDDESPSGEEVRKIYDDRAREIVERATNEHPRKDARATWWETVCNTIPTGDLELSLALWRIMRHEVRWWMSAFPYIEPDRETKIMGPYLSWNTGLSPDGRIIEGSNGWMMGILPTSTELDQFQITDMSHYLISVCLNPALLAIHLLNQDSTSTRPVYPSKKASRTASRFRNYRMCRPNVVHAKSAIEAHRKASEPASDDAPRLANILMNMSPDAPGASNYLAAIQEELPSTPVIIADAMSEQIYSETDKEDFELKEDFHCMHPTFNSIFIETRRPSKVISQVRGKLPSEFLPSLWGFFVNVLDREDLSTSTERDYWDYITGLMGKADESRWIFVCRFITSRSIETQYELKEPHIEEATIFLQLNAEGYIINNPVLVNDPRGNVRRNADDLANIISLSYPMLRAISLLNCINVDMVEQPPAIGASGHQPAHTTVPINYYRLRINTLDETLRLHEAEGDVMPQDYMYYEGGEFHFRNADPDDVHDASTDRHQAN